MSFEQNVAASTGGSRGIGADCFRVIKKWLVRCQFNAERFRR
jgi:hypothetical protein